MKLQSNMEEIGWHGARIGDAQASAMVGYLGGVFTD
jgi:hypothetical protein